MTMNSFQRMHNVSIKKYTLKVGEVAAQQGKTFAIESDGLGSVPGTHMRKE